MDLLTTLIIHGSYVNTYPRSQIRTLYNFITPVHQAFLDHSSNLLNYFLKVKVPLFVRVRNSHHMLLSTWYEMFISTSIALVLVPCASQPRRLVLFAVLPFPAFEFWYSEVPSSIETFLTHLIPIESLIKEHCTTGLTKLSQAIRTDQ